MLFLNWSSILIVSRPDYTRIATVLELHIFDIFDRNALQLGFSIKNA